MKLTVLATAAAATLALVGASTAEAGPRYYGGGSHGGGGYTSGYRGGYSSGYGYVAPQYRPSHCAPVVYKTHTVEVNRYTQCRTAYDHCGRPYTYHVTVVTYCDHYSNGTTRTWSRTFS